MMSTVFTYEPLLPPNTSTLGTLGSLTPNEVSKNSALFFREIEGCQNKPKYALLFACSTVLHSQTLGA